ncbi:hypothetical protein MLD38_012838 [Melastoma candidum]|uniref:Uncharacterized protein n=1 Tax=Melastoma candidum TaxID=119954 RepID=A0ACB9R883_9MYRT|nr:hypothetical protein MLD38_012838 [Melastoma candidum]
MDVYCLDHVNFVAQVEHLLPARQNPQTKLKPRRRWRREKTLTRLTTTKRSYAVYWYPNVTDLPPLPPSAVNPISSPNPDFKKPSHHHFIYRHPNGLCVVGYASGHLSDEGGVKGVDFNVRKSDRRDIKVTGKRMKGAMLLRFRENAQQFEADTMLCKISTSVNTYSIRCRVKGSLLEVNEKFVKQPNLLNMSAEREGFIAIIMPKPADWLKVKSKLGGVR